MKLSSMKHEPGTLQWWEAQVDRSTLGNTYPAVSEILYQSRSGAAAFLAELEDGSQVWIKALGNPQGDQVLVTEYACAKVGQLIGANMAQPLIVEIPSALDQHPLGDPQAHRMRSGPAYATRHISASVETSTSTTPETQPHVAAALFALWDLFLGGDSQWLYPPRSKNPVSFDHSLWLTRGEGDWSPELLQRLVNVPWDSLEPEALLGAEAAEATARALRSLPTASILEILNSVPLQWAAQEDLAALGWFIHHRRTTVADRIEGRARA